MVVSSSSCKAGVVLAQQYTANRVAGRNMMKVSRQHYNERMYAKLCCSVFTTVCSQVITNRGSFASPRHCRLRRGLERLRARTKCSVRIREAYLELRYLHHQRLRRGAFAIWSQVMP